ncbi:polyprenyl synthetase family protein [Bacillus songklensis]|uniref:Polyprenyl synthetase family protein n=1 Tax=Bacillus songklensis TaxID=1069116 RepID=A0ABV8AZ64_9BACI
MNDGEFQAYLAEVKGKVEKEFPAIVSGLSSPKTLIESMNYSLTAGGKRIRPLLIFATLRAFGKEEEIGIPAACAVEMIHTYSLIHDDLPSMDDDDLRRGKPTNHKVFGEAMAILAGDALLTNSFQVLAQARHPDVSDSMKLRLVIELSKAAGAEGMVGGQVADMEGEQKKLSLEELEYIHKNKTGKLLSFCVKAGAILADAPEAQMEQLSEFSTHLGLAFQIRDDILDIEGNEEQLGKPVGSDTENEKTTYPALLGMEAAKEKLRFHIEKAKQCLRNANIQHEILEKICTYIEKRNS